MTARSYQTVEQIMTRDVFSVHQDDVLDLAASLMDWEHVRHVPVEDDDGRLVGLLSYRQLLRFLAHELSHRRGEPVAAREIMQREPITVEPGVRTLDAIALMREKRIPCLPVVQNGALVGIVTERDFLEIAARWFEEQLRRGADDDGD